MKQKSNSAFNELLMDLDDLGISSHMFERTLYLREQDQSRDFCFRLSEDFLANI